MDEGCAAIQRGGGLPVVRGRGSLKVPKCEIVDRSDFHDFYPIKSLWEGDFGVKIKCLKKNI
jgi:hypothetical protein